MGTYRKGGLLLAAALLLCLLAACGGTEAGEAVQPETAYPSAEALSEAAGFVMTELPLEGADGAAYTLYGGTLAEAVYPYQGTTVTLRMSVTASDFSGMPGMEGGKSAGGVQWDDGAFSSLDVSFLGDIYFCAFSYESADGTLYYSLSQTDTDFAGFTNLLRLLVNQITEDNQPETLE